MAIKAHDQLKWVENSKTLELEADTGEAFLIKAIYAYNQVDSYMTVSIDKTTVGYFRTDASNLGNHLHFMIMDSQKKNLLEYLWDIGIFKGYPVAEGQFINLSVPTATSLAILYDIYEPGDISPDMENGSEAKEYMLINYGRKTTSGNVSDGDNEYAVSVLPSEFPDFPFGKDVPAKTQINIYGLLATDVGKSTGSGSNKQITKYIKIVKEREVLFDEDKRGLPLIGKLPSSDTTYVGYGTTVIGNYSSNDMRLPFLFDEPMVFSAGEELTVVLNTEVTAGSANINVERGEIGLIEKVIRTE